jgi:hypothetical protein
MTKGLGLSARFGGGPNTETGGSSLAATVRVGNGDLWKADSARTMLRHRGSTWETVCTVSRPCFKATVASVTRAAKRRLGGDQSVGTRDSLRRVPGLEGRGFGRVSNRTVGMQVLGAAGEHDE